jgi:beta-glucanase (GH16 family)
VLVVGATALTLLRPAGAEETVDPGQPPAQVTDGAPWTPVFVDEFGGDAVDRTRWNVPDESNYGTGGHQDQCYRAGNTTVADGTLRLTAQRETVTDCGSNPDGGDAYYFTSGMVTTRRMGGPVTFRYRHGYAEVRMRAPRGNLYWPAFWLTGPSDGSTPSWPDYGEFDVSEIYGAQPDISESNYHGTLGSIGARSHNVVTKGSSSSLSINPPNPLVAGGTNDWHTYGFNWTENRLEWFIDGVLVRTYNASTPEDLASFGYDHSIILNLQVGGSGPAYEGYTGGERDDGYDDGNLSADLPGTMEVDYVRVWQAPPPAPPTPPVVTIAAPAPDETVTTVSTALAGTCETPAGTVTVDLRGSSTSSTTAPCVEGAWAASATLAPGAYSVTASQTAEITGASAPVDFTVVLPAPADEVTLEAPEPGALLGAGPVALSGRCAVDGGGIAVTADPAPDPIAVASCDANGVWSTTATLTDGHWFVTATQIDSSGTAPSRASTGFDVDATAPQTGDDTAAIGAAWRRGPVTVGLTPTDAGSGVALTRFTIDGSLPDATSPTGTSVTLASEGVFTIRYASVDRAGNVESVRTAATPIRIDRTAPVTTDDAATIGTAWSKLDRTVRLTPTDASAGVAATYATVDGSTPTSASPSGTMVALTTSGAFTLRYFSVDAAGNVEPTKTSGTTVRIDKTPPTSATTSPVDGQSYGSSTWGSGCSSSARICGTASDLHSGLASVRVSVQRSSDSRWWNGSAWVTGTASVAASGTSSWSTPLSTSQLTNKVTYTVSAWATDAVGNTSPTTTRRFTYDTSGPTTTASALTVTNKNGAVTAGDRLSVTFNEALNPATVPAASTLTLSRARDNTSYKITGLTNGSATTGTTGYLTSSSSTRTVSYAGTLALSTDGRTVTFTVTGSCTGTCSALASTSKAGAFQFSAASTLKDVAGNAASTSSVTAASQVMF